MQASGGGAGGAEGRDDQHSSRTPASQNGSGRAEGEDGHRAPEGRGGPGRGREAMEAAVARPRGERAPGGLGPAGDVAPLAVRPRRGQVVLCEEARDTTNSVMDDALTVSHPAHSECLKAYRSLLPDAQHHQGLIWKEFAVNGSDLILPCFHLTFHQPDQLSLVIQNIRCLGLPPPQASAEERG
ncbi:hypothetical protein FD755_023709 [Muntiacus reevesi]|uniref:Uncharacterized protein n=1 Tax=Muntiacus reevesi TaxID=9886 RepID=A0A5N3VWM6_MUNRE|nr:hypothetical protein FD755_023709 [Muntiacus reevesi]